MGFNAFFITYMVGAPRMCFPRSSSGDLRTGAGDGCLERGATSARSESEVVSYVHQAERD